MRADKGMNLLVMLHSPVTTGAMSSRAHQPSMSAALTEERVRIFFCCKFRNAQRCEICIRKWLETTYGCISALLHPPTIHSWPGGVLVSLVAVGKLGRLRVLVTQLVNVGCCFCKNKEKPSSSWQGQPKG
jgi:hypothetical protein